jgi:hypothetical protein
MQAVQNQNLDGVEFLVETYGADVNGPLTVEEETPLSMAKETGNAAIIDYLLSHGARDIERHPELIYCDRANFSPLDYEKLVQIIQLCQTKSLEDLLPLLPTTLRSDYTLAYQTFGLQEASADFPRAVLYGRDGKLILTFNGDEGQRGFNTLELIQFRDQTKQFEMREITFDAKRKAAPQFSEKNPAQCLACHGSSPRPLWDNWTFWPGHFFGEMEAMYSREKVLYQRYLVNRDSGRYKNLLATGLAPLQLSLGTDDEGPSQNLKMDVLVGEHLQRKMASEISAESRLKPFRYAILAGLSCSQDTGDFVPAEVQAQLPRSISDFDAETKAFSRAEFIDRYNLLARILPGAPEGRYEFDRMMFPLQFPEDGGGRNLETTRVARLRYFIEGLGISMDSWFAQFDHGKHRYVATGNFSPLLAMIWKELLTPADDAELRALYQSALDKIAGQGSPYFFVYKNDEEQKAICPLLKAKSLKALEGWRK